MALQAGHLLNHRMQLALAAGANDIDTGICQVNLAMSPDPPLGGVAGVTASRVMVVVLPPFDNWSGVTIGEPTLDPVTNTVHVVFTAPGDVTVNVMIWNPHTHVCPLSADLYGNPAPPGVLWVLAVEEGLGVATRFGGA